MSIFDNDRGFFQRGKSFGGLGLKGLFEKLGKAAGIRKCPYTGKPLTTPTELQSGIADEVASQQIPPTGNYYNEYSGLFSKNPLDILISNNPFDISNNPLDILNSKYRNFTKTGFFPEKYGGG